MHPLHPTTPVPVGVSSGLVDEFTAYVLRWISQPHAGSLDGAPGAEAAVESAGVG